MHRSFKITLPADTAVHNLFSLIVGTATYGSANGGTNETGVTGAIPTDGIFPDRGIKLEIQSDQGNTGTITVSDRNNANTSGKVLNAGDTILATASANSICLKDYNVKASVNSQVLEVECEFT